ncbi:MAG: acetyl-CoA carboxylase biotin carboxyl carrier protein subunit [Anaerolineae bacterium]|nr:acetyl-CoA carboxylase biotin carboxyl carrier protein subunit [Anaerolineae bacterium]
MPNYRVTIAGRSYDVEIPDPSERPVRAIVNGEVYEVHVGPAGLGHSTAAGDTAAASMRVASPQPPATRATSGTPASSSSSPLVTPAPAIAEGGQVFAPLPGTIVSISVVEGESVVHGQELCILEAMKMNNPIRATQPGVVREILVSVGEQVQHGVPLMVIEASGSSAEA